MVAPFYHEQQLKLDGETYRLSLNFAAIDAAESLLAPLTFDQIVGKLLDGTAPLATQARVVWGLLREHHPELSIDQASSFVIGKAGEATGAAIGQLILAAFPIAEPGEKKANPRKPRGTSANSSSNGRRRA